MDTDKYIYIGSPLIRSINSEAVQKILKAVLQDRQWPQDAIASELLGRFIIELPEIIGSTDLNGKKP